MRVFLTVIFLAVLGYGLGFVLFVSNLPVAPQSLPRADGIVALTGGGERLDTAVALLENGVGKRLLISGVAQETTQGDAGQDGGRRRAFRLLRRYRLCRRRHPWQCRGSRQLGARRITSTAW